METEIAVEQAVTTVAENIPPNKTIIIAVASAAVAVGATIGVMKLKRMVKARIAAAQLAEELEASSTN